MVNDTDTTTFTYNEMNELTGITHPDTSTETLTYDNNGNLTQTINNTMGETTAYEWDCFDRLTKVTLPAKGGATSGETVEFEYDSDGMLIGEKSGGMERRFTQQSRFATREVIKNGQDEWETSAMHVIHGTMLATYIGATSRHFGGKKQISHDTKTIFYHTDHLGSVRLITDSHGNVVSSSTTDAYGNPMPRETANNISGESSTPNTPPGSPKNKGAKMLSNFNFIGTHGIRYVEKVKLHNMRARWYGKALSSFISTDPIKSRNSKEKTNLYAYSESNPLKYIDISGLFNISPPSQDTPQNQTKLRCLNIELRRLCPNASNLVNNIPFSIENIPHTGDMIGNPMAEFDSDRTPATILFNESDWLTFNASDQTQLRYWAYVLMEEIIHLKQFRFFSSYRIPINNSVFVGSVNSWYRWLRDVSLSPPPGQTWHHGYAPTTEMTGIYVIYEILAAYALQHRLNTYMNTATLTDVLSRINNLHPRLNNPNSPAYDPYLGLLYLVNTTISVQHFNDFYVPEMLRRQMAQREVFSIYCEQGLYGI